MKNPLLKPIRALLLQNTQRSWSEYELLGELVQQGLLQEDYGRDTLDLFKAHFLTMNALYQLQKEFMQDELGLLDISALTIELKAWITRESTDQKALDTDTAGPLADYYLDWSNLQKTDSDDVENLLQSFWQRFLQPNERQQALAVLGLEDPVSMTDIKQRYRQMAMQHHPDRGGSSEDIQQLNHAMDVLKRQNTF